MFYFLFGLVCGIVIGQEVDNLPKLKPHLEALYTKLFQQQIPPAPPKTN